MVEITSCAHVLSAGGLALVAAIIALWLGRLLRRQLEQRRTVTAIDVYVRVASTLRDLDVFFADHPDPARAGGHAAGQCPAGPPALVSVHR